MALPFWCRMLRSAAYLAQSWSVPVANASRAAAAPAMAASMSTPAAAIGSRPTAVSTEKRPPMLFGTTKVS